MLILYFMTIWNVFIHVNLVSINCFVYFVLINICIYESLVYKFRCDQDIYFSPCLAGGDPRYCISTIAGYTVLVVLVVPRSPDCAPGCLGFLTSINNFLVYPVNLSRHRLMRCSDNLIYFQLFWVNRDGCHMWGNKFSLFPKHPISLPLGSSWFHPFIMHTLQNCQSKDYGFMVCLLGLVTALSWTFKF